MQQKPAKRTISLPMFSGALIAVALVSFTIGTRVETVSLANLLSPKQGPAQLDLASIQTTYDELRSQFDGELDANKLIEGANKGLVEAAGDPYTTYFSSEEANEFFNDLEGKFSGIGAELQKKDTGVVISSTIENTPARAAGLQSGDVIVQVNDEDATTWSVEEAVSKIRGDAGTTVKLVVLRGTEAKEFSVTRANIVNPSVTSEITDDNIGILRISRFGETETYDLVKRAAEDFKSKNVKAVVLDLRGNGGGYLNAAQQIAGVWMNDKVVVTERRDGKVVDTLKTGNSAILNGIPTTVLVDGGSASASEILAGALKDNGVATLVGQKTFGKGSVQTTQELSNGGVLKVTIAKWYTPNGRNISKEGIEPDQTVEYSAEDINAGRDPVKDAALTKLRAN